MAYSTILCDDEIWQLFKKSVPRNLKVSDAILLLIYHYVDMGDSGKTMMEILMKKYGVEQKEIKCKYLKLRGMDNGNTIRFV